MSSVASTPAASPVSAGHKPSASAKTAGKAAIVNGGDTFDKALDALDAQESPVTAGSKPAPRDAEPAAKIAPSRPRSSKDNASRETDDRPNSADKQIAADAAPALPAIDTSQQTATAPAEAIELDSPLPSTLDAPTEADVAAESRPAPSQAVAAAAVPTALIDGAAEAPPVSASPFAPIAEAVGMPAADPSLTETANGAPVPVPLSNAVAASDDAAVVSTTTPAATAAKPTNPPEKAIELPMPSAPPLAAAEETPATPEVAELAALAFDKAPGQPKPHEKSQEHHAQPSAQDAGKHAAQPAPASGDTPARAEMAPDLQRIATPPQHGSFDPSQILNAHPSPYAAGASAGAAAAPHAPAETLAAAGPAITLAGLPIEIAARAREGISRFDIRLDPPELGRIEVRLDIDREGNVNSRLVVDRSETLDLLRRHAPGLERALEQAGLTTKQDGLEFSLRDQPSANRDQRELDAESPTKPQPVIIPDLPAIVSAAQRSYNLLRGLGAGIDIRV